MSRKAWIGALPCLLAMTSCSANGVSSAVSRFPAPNTGGRMHLPLCLPGAAAGASLAERATWEERMATCALAARAEGVAIATSPGGACLRADVELSSRFADKARNVGGGSAAGVHRKKMRMVVHDPQTNEVLLETVAIIESTRREIVNSSVYALCAATFRGYPDTTRNEQQEIEVPSEVEESTSR